MERLEGVLSERDYLLGDRVTASDLMLLPTLVRFDAVYAVLFKCSKRRIRDYPCLTRWMQRMMELQCTRRGDRMRSQGEVVDRVVVQEGSL